MKRKLACFGLCFAGAELFAAVLPPLVLVPAAAFLVCLFFLLLYRRSQYLPLAVGALCGLAWFCGFWAVQVHPIQALAGQTVRCTVTVETDAEAAYLQGQMRGTLRVQEINGKPYNTKLYCLSFPAQQPGECFTADFQLESLSKDRYRTSRLSRGVLLQAEYAGSYVRQQDSGALRFKLYSVRKKMAAALCRWLPRETGGLEAAMLLGDKSALQQSSTEAFRTAGVSHLLAVSGLHVALICGLLSWGTYGRKRRYSRMRIAARALLAVSYVLLTGTPVSAVRAGIVFVLALLGDFFFQPVDLLTLTGAAAVLLGLQNPYAPCDIGFQLSFCAVLGVQAATALSAWEKQHMPQDNRLMRLMQLLLVQVQTAAFAALATLPVLLAHGLAASGVSVLTNLLTLWAVQPALVLGIAVLLLQLLPFLTPLAHMASLFLAILLQVLLLIVRWCASLPIAHLVLPRRYALLVLTALGILALLFWLCGRLRYYPAAAALCTAVAVALGCIMQKDIVRLALVGSAGNPAVVCTQNGQAVVLFRGGEGNLRAVQDYLAENGNAEVVLTVDLRRSASAIDLPAEQVLSLQAASEFSSRQILDGLTLDLYHSNKGNLAVLGDGRYHIAAMAGSPEFAGTVNVDVLCAAGTLSDSVQPNIILYTAAAPRWLQQAGESHLLYGSETPIIVLRPGKTMTFEETQTVALQ